MVASARNDQRSVQFSRQHIDKHICSGAKFIVDVPKLGGVASSSLTSPDSTYQDPTAAIVCYRRVGERYQDCSIVERQRLGGGSVMLWGGITTHDRTRLIILEGNLNAQRYCDKVLEAVALPFLRRRHQDGQEAMFQQDNARPHTAWVTTNLLDQHQVRVLPWPAVSPDYSPIEHVRDCQSNIGQIANSATCPTSHGTLRELSRDLQQFWEQLPQEFLAHLVSSMRRRCTAVIIANGGHTSY